MYWSELLDYLHFQLQCFWREFWFYCHQVIAQATHNKSCNRNFHSTSLNDWFMQFIEKKTPLPFRLCRSYKESKMTSPPAYSWWESVCLQLWSSLSQLVWPPKYTHCHLSSSYPYCMGYIKSRLSECYQVSVRSNEARNTAPVISSCPRPPGCIHCWAKADKQIQCA